MTDAQFSDLIARGCAKVNISTALKVAYMKSNLAFLRERRGSATAGTRRRCSRTSGGRHGRWRPTTCAGSAASARRGERRGRARRWSSTATACSPTPSGTATCPRSTRRSPSSACRCAGTVAEYRREAADRRRQGADGEPAHPGVRRGGRAARRIRRASTPPSPRGTGARRRSTGAGGRRRGPGPARGSPGSSARPSTAGWPVAVASTSARGSVRATLEHAVGRDLARAGPRSSPATSCRARSRRRTSTCSRLSGSAGRPARCSSSRTRATGCWPPWPPGLPASSPSTSFTGDEDFTEAALVVSSLGDPGGERPTVLANRSRASPAPGSRWPTWREPRQSTADIGTAGRNCRGTHVAASFGDVEVVVRTIATVAVDNEKYFGDLDAVVGDGDFGYSMARGFELVLRGLGQLRPRRHRHVPEADRRRHHQPDRRHLGADLGHGVPARRRRRGRSHRAHAGQVVAMLRAAIEGIKARGSSDVGDKTLLDALVPRSDTIEERVGGGADRGGGAASGGDGRPGAGRGDPADAGHARAGQPTRASAASARSTPGPWRSP